MTAVWIFVICAYAVFNLFTAKCWSAKEMKRDFVDGQCLVGKVFANLFYAPAWFLKAVRFVVLRTIK